MTYLELENMFGDGKGVPRSSITRGLRDLLAKGFIEIIRQGGAYQKDKTVYGLSDDWQWWHSGLIIRENLFRKKIGWATHENNLNRQSDTHTHRQSETLKPEFRVAE